MTNATNAHTCESDIIIRSFRIEIFNTTRIEKEYRYVLQDQTRIRQIGLNLG